MRWIPTGIVLVCLLLVLPSCTSTEQDELVIYSGRSQVLVEPLVEEYRQATGAQVRVRYGSDAQLLAALEEEGTASPADVFWANTTGALGHASQAGLLTELPDSLLQRPARFTPSNGLWLPITTRFRVLAYNADQVDSEELPPSVLDLPDLEQFEGRVGWTPSYSSFQDFVTAMREVHGEEITREWLEGMQALNPNAYPSNTPMVRALADGEIDIALTNHYYVLRLKYGDARVEEEDVEPDVPVEMYHFEDGDVGNLALVTGAGVLQTNNQDAAAHEFLGFLLSDQAQRFAATTLNEYPLVSETEGPAYLRPTSEAVGLSPEFDFERLSDLDATLQLLRDVGAL